MKKIISIFLTFVMALCFFTSALASDYSDKAMTDTAQYIYETVTEPQVGSIGGEWAIIALARSGVEIEDKYFSDYYNAVEKYVAVKNGVLHNRKYTEYSRVILALTAIGKNPADVSRHNLLLPLGDFEKTIWQGVNGAIWALIALDSKNYEIPENPDAKTQATRDMYIEYILESQNTDGGWALSKGAPSDIDITAMALSALSGYLSSDKVNSAVENGLNFLEKRQNESGGFSGGETCESSAQVLSALCALGIKYDSPRFVKDGKTVLDDLLSYRDEKGFKHIRSGSVNQMATEQACYALVSLYRFENGMPKINDMTDSLKIEESEIKNEESTVTKEISFIDTKNHKNEEAIKRLAQKGIINGKSENVFDPENTMTRAEFATIIVKALGLELKEEKVFSDVCENDWFYTYVATAYECGIINGVGNNLFNPYGTITRQESAVMLSRSAKLMGMNTDMETMASRDILSMYVDYIKTSDWAIKPLAFCISEGIINEEGLEILPKKEVTRAEIAQMVYNLLERVERI